MVAGRPLVAGKFGCRVVRGPNWQYGDEEATRGQGVVLEPDNGILEEWASGGISGACGGEYNTAWGMHTGGWWLDRSCVVQWLGSGAIYYYRSGDNDKFDLYEIVPGFLISIGLIIIVSLFDRKPSAEICEQFNQIAKP